MNRKENNDSRASPLPWEDPRTVVTIETPEQVELHVPLAPFGTRIYAALIDYCILALINIFFIGLFFLALLMGRHSKVEDAAWYFFALFTTLFSLMNLLYFVWFEFRGRGQTPGKKMARIRTVMNTGQGLTFPAALLRNLARLVDNFPLLWIVPGLDKAKRRTGDLLAHTLVIDTSAQKDKPVALSVGDSYAALENKLFTFTTDIFSRVSPEDINLLEYFFSRTRKVTAARTKRKKTAEQIAERYCKRLELADQETEISEHPFRFLEEFYLFLKDRYEQRGF